MPLPDLTDPPSAPKQRRRSFMDYGGPNSINNFASSYSRAQQYIGTSFMEQGGEYMESPPQIPSRPLHEDNEAFISSDDNSIRSDNNSNNQTEHMDFPLPPPIDWSNNSVFDETSELLPTLSRVSTKRHSFSLITGNSTAAQTIFNSINALIGIGMLSLPLGFKMSGWLFGSLLLVVSAFLTNTTAKYLGKILYRHQELMTYGDIAYAYGGKYFLYLVTLFFVIDLFGASLTLIILFADSFTIVWPHVPALKAIIVAVVFVLSLLPLSMLSIFSLLGIISTVGIILSVFICGFLVDTSPGSLLIPATTTLLPPNPINLLFSLGIFMAPWGGHPVFPELYRDMRHPFKFTKSSNISFLVTYLLDFSIGATGYLMYGLMVDDSIVKSIMQNPNYPPIINSILCILMGILPISKLPLVTKPIITSYENIFGITAKYVKLDENGKLTDTYGPTRVFSRLLFCCVLLISALLLTSFGKLVAFLGSAICYTVCLTLPLLFYLKLNRSSVGKLEGLLIKIGIVFSITATILGTYASIGLTIPE